MNSYKKIIKPEKKTAVEYFSRCLCHQISALNSIPDRLVFVCIGTELVLGDSLGPLVGYQLERLKPAHVSIYGTLKDPVHAMNLREKVDLIEKKHPKSCIIAIDASFGSRRNLGAITIQPGPVLPGLGVKKELPPVGHISITGITCIHGPFGHERLQATPLSLLLPQVDTIVHGILRSCSLLTSYD